MTQSLVISRNVINTIKSLPVDQQLSILSAIAGEMILGADVNRAGLSIGERRIYDTISRRVRDDSLAYAEAV